MTDRADRPRELDVVELLVAVDGWPAGTRATVLEVTDEELLLDVDADVSHRGLLDDFIGARPSDVKVVERPPPSPSRGDRASVSERG